MQEFGKSFIQNMPKLIEKYNTTEILMNGYYGLHIVKRDIVPPEYEVP